MALNGSLDDYSPAGALRVLSSTGKTGAVRFTGAAGCTVYLHEGQLYFARGEGTDEALASALVRAGRVEPTQWTEAVEAAGDRPVVGENLIDGDALEADLLASVVLSVVYDPLIELFRQGDGTFEFEPETMHWIGPFHPFNVDAIVNEVRRRVREVDEMSQVIGSLDVWVTPSRTLPDGASQVTLLREDWELVTCLGSPRSIADLADDMGRGRWSTARVVARLADAGLVSVVAEVLGEMPDGDEVLAPEPSTATGTTPETATDPLAAEPGRSSGDGWSEGVWGDEHGVGSNGDGADDDDAPRRAVDEFAAAWAATGSEDQLDPSTAFDHEPLASAGNGYEPQPAVDVASDDRTDEAEPLPVRSSVAVSDQPGPTRTNPWPAAEDLDDEATDQSLSALVGIGGFREVGTPTHHESAEDFDSQLHPNAEWLQGLYAQFMDEPEADGGKKHKKEALDVAFATDSAADEGEKVGTLRRLMDALKRL